MKQFIAFFGNAYYPSGGMEDMIGDYDSVDEAANAINEEIKKINTKDVQEIKEFNWMAIYDIKHKQHIIENCGAYIIVTAA